MFRTPTVLLRRRLQTHQQQQTQLQSRQQRGQRAQQYPNRERAVFLSMEESGNSEGGNKRGDGRGRDGSWNGKDGGRTVTTGGALTSLVAGFVSAHVARGAWLWLRSNNKTEAVCSAGSDPATIITQTKGRSLLAAKVLAANEVALARFEKGTSFLRSHTADVRAHVPLCVEDVRISVENSKGFLMVHRDLDCSETPSSNGHLTHLARLYKHSRLRKSNKIRIPRKRLFLLAARHGLSNRHRPRRTITPSTSDPAPEPVKPASLPFILSNLQSVTETFSDLTSHLVTMNSNLFTPKKSEGRLPKPLQALQSLLEYMTANSGTLDFKDVRYLQLLQRASRAGSVLAKYNLAVCLVEMGQIDAAIGLFGEVVASAEPGSQFYEDSLFNLRVLLVRADSP
ncbi:hypothetical protein BC830DRAFT_1129739 [Chytriomyces sp. MP71]|nr:hypothetical protein BC830DRAFT_1129739 [Chytriomyces sp. MP71]